MCFGVDARFGVHFFIGSPDTLNHGENERGTRSSIRGRLGAVECGRKVDSTRVKGPSSFGTRGGVWDLRVPPLLGSGLTVKLRITLVEVGTWREGRNLNFYA